MSLPPEQHPSDVPMTSPTPAGKAESYTPGPWRVIPYDAGDVPYLAGVPAVVASDDLDCAIVHWRGFAQEYWRSARGDKEMQANARLIAAAPQMLEALKAIDALWLEDFAPPGDPDEARILADSTLAVWRQIRSAITLATQPPGES